MPGESKERKTTDIVVLNIVTPLSPRMTVSGRGHSPYEVINGVVERLAVDDHGIDECLRESLLEQPTRSILMTQSPNLARVQ